MTAASPSPAAEPLPAPVVSAADPGARKTLVVRADPHTGKLVRSMVVAPRAVMPLAAAKPVASAPTNGPIKDLVERSAKAHHVDPLLVDAVIRVESNYNPHAVSNKGAEGLMQLMPPTARMLGVSNSFDPGQNIEAGVKYLKYLQDLYKDDQLALAAYNAGPGAVDRYKSVPPIRETQDYVYKVGKRYGEAREAASKESARKTAAEVKPEPPAPKPKLASYIDENGRLHLRTTHE
jgi:soluble lytic murein transglycosylase-like protein